MRTTHRLVIGPGGSGRTHRLRAWVDQLDPALGVVWISGSSIRAVDEVDLAEAVADRPDVLVVDDLQWFTDGALSMVSDLAKSVSVFASRRPWPSTERLRMLDDQLTARDQAERTVFLDPEDFTPFLAELMGRTVSGSLADQLFATTGGSVGLAADAVASRWDGDLANLPEALIDAVVGRVRRAGPDAVALAMVLAVEPGLDPGLAARALPVGIEARGAQRGIRSGGLTDTIGGLLPLVQRALLADLSTPDLEELHDRLGAIMAGADPDRAARHLEAGAADNADSIEALLVAAERVRRSDPNRALELVSSLDRRPADDSRTDDGPGDPASDRAALVRAEASFHLGRASALAGLADAGGVTSQRGAVLGYGLDLRELRWIPAADRELPPELGPHLVGLAGAAIGRFDQIAELPAPTGPVTSMLASLIEGLERFAFGRPFEALASLAAAVDDHDRLQPDLTLGFTPHLLASLVAVGIGDLPAAEDFALLGSERCSPGEALSAGLQLAYVRMLDGRYSDALTLVRDGEGTDWSGRDRLLLAVLDAGLARRSGDTTRLREAWRRADPVLVRHSPSWLLVDPLTELAAAGAKLGHHARVDPVIETLTGQVETFSPSSPARANVAWLRLQTGLAANQADVVATVCDDMSMYTSPTPRSQARLDAARLWSGLLAFRQDVADDASPATALPDEASFIDVAAALADGGESWEASRLVGQAAIEVDDPGAARRLLERARSFTVDLDEAESEDPLVALGLSEREADVARLVADGRTHKEVGAQLFISPKTVEHHVARIRQKLGAGTRAELLSAIREAL